MRVGVLFAGNNINIIYLKIDAQDFNICDITIIHMDSKYMGLSLSMHVQNLFSSVQRSFSSYLSKMMKY